MFEQVVRFGVRAAFISGLTFSAAAQQAPVPSVQQEKPDVVVITGMIPPPDVGQGAPYHSPQEIKLIATAAQRDAVTATIDGRTAGRSAACKDSVQDISTSARMSAMAALDRTPTNLPRLQGLYRDEKSRATRVSQLAGKALVATDAAEDSRRAAAQGANNKATVEKLEIARQKAVNALEKERLKLMETQAAIADYGDLRMRGGSQTISWVELDIKAMQRRKAGWGLGVPKETKIKDIDVANLQAAERQDDRGFFLQITGVVTNTGDKAAPVPEFIVSIIDRRGFPLRNVMGSMPSSLRIPRRRRSALQL